jgi:hypothetical protein
MADVLVYFGRGTDWFDVYKAAECLEQRFGGEHVFRKLRWAPATEMKRLKRTANSFRHARKQGPNNPMTHQEARHLLGVLVRRAFEAIEAGRAP